jgi:hypothetical protein
MHVLREIHPIKLYMSLLFSLIECIIELGEGGNASMAGEKSGANIIALARTCIGQRYVLGAKVPKDNPHWKGPWDCAEFASWCVFQSYGIVFGMRPARADRGDSYSGFWYDDADEPGAAIPWRDALHIAGAFLVRRPRPKLIGHVAISLGDGKHTIEARSAKLGVNQFDGADDRPWDIGVLLPGVEYEGGASSDTVDVDPNFVPPPQRVPAGYFALQTPQLTGPAVLAIQIALDKASYDPGPLDGDFGPMTEAAVASFQAERGLELDGIVGPQTASALTLNFPIAPSSAIVKRWNDLRHAAAAPLPAPLAAGTGDRAIKRFIKSGSKHSVEFMDGSIGFVGREVSYSDDMHRWGLYQDKDLASIKDVGVYVSADYIGSHGKWAYFIRPTIKAESSGYFGRLNTYDRAAFTFGATQLAAHTPDENLILLFRKLVRELSSNAADYFPELSLVGGKLTWTRDNGSIVNLEAPELFTRPNGIKEKQLRNFMNYLNPEAVAVDSEEVSAGARLMAWTKEDPRARAAQVELLVARAQALIAMAKAKVPHFDGNDWRIALWIVDILYQGRGTFTAIRAALAHNDPLTQLAKIGSSYKERLKTVKDEIATLDADGVLDGFRV